MKKILLSIISMVFAVSAMAQFSFDDLLTPVSPGDPNANYYNAETGEVFIDLMEPGTLAKVIRDMGLGDYTNKVTITAELNSDDLNMFILLGIMKECDLSKARGIVSIPKAMFNYQTDLVYLSLPASVVSIEANTFQYCKSLELLKCYATTPPAISKGLFDNCSKDFVVHVPAEAVQAYKSAEGWKDYTILGMDESEEYVYGSASISLYTSDGDDVTESVTIKWYDAKGDEVGEGCTINNRKEGEELLYAVRLPYELSNEYNVPSAGKVVIEGDKTINLMLSPLPANAFRGSEIGYTINIIPADDEEDAVSLPPNKNYNDLAFEIVNETKQQKITEFAVFDSRVVLSEEISEGDIIAMTVKSISEQFKPSTEQCEISRSGNSSIDFNVIEYGRIAIDFSGNDDVANAMCYLYDSAGKLAGSAANVGKQFKLNRVPDGTYTAVMIQSNSVIGTVQNLSTLGVLGLAEGRDYAQLQVAATAGKLSNYSAIIPVFDEESHNHLSDECYVTNISKFSIIVGREFTLKTKVEFNDADKPNISDAKIIVQLPENTNLVAGSICTNFGNTSYTMTGSSIELPIGQKEIMKMCIETKAPGVVSPTVLVKYKYNGAEITQKVGDVSVAVYDMIMNVPVVSNDGEVYISGVAVPESKVRIFDGNVMIAETKVLANGAWSTKAKLSEEYNCYHSVHADYQGLQGNTLSSPEYIVYVDDKAQALVQKDLYIDSEHIRINATNGRMNKNYYSFNPSGSCLFTFTATLTNSDKEEVCMPYFEVYMTNGMMRTLVASYNDEKQVWTASSKFEDNDALPCGFNFKYSVAPDTLNYTEYVLEKTTENMVAAGKLMEDEYSNLVKIGNIITNTEDKFEVETTIGDAPYVILCENIDYNTALNNMQGTCFCYPVDNDTLLVCPDDTEERFQITYLYASSKRAVRFCLIPRGNEQIKDVNIRHHKILGVGALLTVIGTVGTTIKLYQSGTEFIDLVNELRNEYIQLYRYYSDMLAQAERRISALLAMKCPDGEPYIKDSKSRADFADAIRANAKFLKNAENEMKVLDARIWRRLLSEGGKILGGMIASHFGSTIKTDALGVSGSVQSVVDYGRDTAIDDISGEALDHFLEGKESFEQFFRNKIIGLKSMGDVLLKNMDKLYNIINARGECDDKPEDQPGGGGTAPEPITPISDPSGFVYEGVESNRVEGVTATIYYRDSESTSEEDAIEWNAEDFGQENPVITDADGMYAWDVPKGLWQVRFEKDGYEYTCTEWLPVPPPQLDVNVPVVQFTAPHVADAKAYENSVVFEFSKYMNADNVMQNVSVIESGENVFGTIEATNAEVNALNEVLASQYRFVPQTAFKAKTITLIVNAEAKSYADVEMEREYRKSIEVQGEVQSISISNFINAYCGKNTSFTVSAIPASAVAGKKLAIDNNSFIYSVVNKDIVFDQNGNAEIEIRGELPGEAKISVGVGNKSASATVGVSYQQPNKVASPYASVASGYGIEKGTAISLFCDTEGATIYYTLDGSCPCDETTRIKYDGTPIILNSDMTIKIMAEYSNYEDSNVITFMYKVATGILSTTASEGNVEYYNTDGQRINSPASKGIYIIKTVSNAGISTQKIMRK